MTCRLGLAEECTIDLLMYVCFIPNLKSCWDRQTIPVPAALSWSRVGFFEGSILLQLCQEEEVFCCLDWYPGSLRMMSRKVSKIPIVQFIDRASFVCPQFDNPREHIFCPLRTPLRKRDLCPAGNHVNEFSQPTYSHFLIGNDLMTVFFRLWSLEANILVLRTLEAFFAYSGRYIAGAILSLLRKL